MPYTIEAQKLGLNVLAHLGDMQAAFPMTVVAVNRGFLQQKRSVVKQFMAGYSEAIYRLMQFKETGINIYKKYSKMPKSWRRPMMILRANSLSRRG
jgi:ABC-type nitrate/sulfonate/bicarbonate transport system substrate-binding protein